MSLQTQTNKISGVVNLPFSVSTPSQINEFIDVFRMFCDTYSKEYYIIFHNRDINADGEFKTPHIHFLIDTSGVSDRKRLSTHLTNIANALNVDNLCVSVDPWRLYESAIQYLIHKNDSTKVRYNSSEIITNQTKNYLDLILNKECSDSITIEQIINLCRQYKSISIIYEKLGLKNSKLYRNVIYDVFREFNPIIND